MVTELWMSQVDSEMSSLFRSRHSWEWRQYPEDACRKASPLAAATVEDDVPRSYYSDRFPELVERQVNQVANDNSKSSEAAILMDYQILISETLKRLHEKKTALYLSRL